MSKTDTDVVVSTKKLRTGQVDKLIINNSVEI